MTYPAGSRILVVVQFITCRCIPVRVRYPVNLRVPGIYRVQVVQRAPY
jgi:hypothetical protein